MLRAPLFKGTTGMPGARGLCGLGRPMPPGLCPTMLCGSPWSIPSVLSQQHLSRHWQKDSADTRQLQPLWPRRKHSCQHCHGLPQYLGNRNPLEGATVPTHEAFAGLFQGDPAWSCKADFLWPVWLLATTGRALTPEQSPCASVPASELC